MKYYLCITGLIFFSSCGVYNNSFDCPPGKGIGCAPVSEVLDLIVEKKKGEDVFVKNKGTALLLKQQEEDELVMTPTPAKKKYYLVQDEKGNTKLVKITQENKS